MIGFFIKFFILIGLSFIHVGCASKTPPPLKEISNAKIALANADDIGASSLAKKNFTAAKRYFQQMKRLMKKKRFKEAKEAALKAKFEANLSYEKAQKSKIQKKFNKIDSELKELKEKIEDKKEIVSKKIVKSEKIDKTVNIKKEKLSILNMLNVKKTSRGVELFLSEVFFVDGKASLQDMAKPTMDKFIEYFHNNPNRDILIKSYCDVSKSKTSNLDLAIRMAESVKNTLLKGGISEEKINIKSYAKRDTTTSKGREVVVLIK